MFGQTSSAAVRGGESIHRIAQNTLSGLASPWLFTMGRCLVNSSKTDKTEPSTLKLKGYAKRTAPPLLWTRTQDKSTQATGYSMLRSLHKICQAFFKSLSSYEKVTCKHGLGGSEEPKLTRSQPTRALKPIAISTKETHPTDPPSPSRH